MPKQSHSLLPTIFRSLLFYVMAGILAIPFLLLWPAILAPRKVVYLITDRYLLLVLWLLRTICRIDFRVSGLENFPAETALIASQHESTWETLFFQLIFDHPLMYAKKSIFSYIVFGPILQKMGHIPVEKSPSGNAMREGLQAGVAALKDGQQLLIFPSGTRRLEHSELHAGVGVLYQLSNVPVLPVRLNSGKVWPPGTWLKYPGVIEVQIEAPIEAGLDRRDFMQILSACLAD